MVYKNPKPVVVMIIPTTLGVMLVRRGDRDGSHGLALPGGYQEEGETWQAAGCREVLEETGIELTPAGVRLVDVHTVGAALDVNLIYGCYYAPITVSEDYRFFSDETLAVEFVNHPVELVFPSHTNQLAAYFGRQS